MTIFRGLAEQQGSSVVIQTPVGDLGGIKAVRLTNYTGDALILTDIDTERPGQQYLMPFQQSVYRIENMRQPVRASAITLGTEFDTATLLVEWSTEPLADFPGTYPVTLTDAPIVAQPTAPFDRISLLHLVTAATTYVVNARPRRRSITFINAGTTNITWNDRDVFTSQPIIVPGSGRTMQSQGAFYFQSDADGGLLEVDQD